MVIRVLECALDGEDSRVSGLLPRCMITASVATLGLDERDGEVLFDQVLVELGQLAVGVVRDDANFFSSSSFDPGSHIELAHGDNVDATGLVVRGDCLGTQQSGLLNMSVSSARDGRDDRRNGPQQNTSGTQQYGWV